MLTVNLFIDFEGRQIGNFIFFLVLDPKDLRRVFRYVITLACSPNIKIPLPFFLLQINNLSTKQNRCNYCILQINP